MKKTSIRRWALVIIIILAIGGIAGLTGYRAVFGQILKFDTSESQDIYLHDNISLDSLKNMFVSYGWLEKTSTWDLTARLLRIGGDVKAGHYTIQDNINAPYLLRKFLLGWQDPVRMSFHGVRLKEDLAGRIAPSIRLDSASILNALNNTELLEKYDLTLETATRIFIPNTYEVYWTIDEEGLFDRMMQEYQNFWNKDRSKKASAMGLTPEEVVVLASIVQEETNKADEMSRVAGVYVNRLNRGMKLEADPTARYANGLFGVRRVLSRDLEIESPYNTYKVFGLPPGPITIPEPNVIEASLNYESHDYIFMCAKADRSGYHAFAKTNAQHERNSAAYKRALNAAGIYR